MGASRSSLTCACSTITQRQPMLCAAAANARPWLPSVALMTTKSRSASACRPANRSAGVQPRSGQRRSTSRSKATGAPSTLKLPSAERRDSSFTTTCAMPSCAASRGSGHAGVGCGESRSQVDSHWRLSRPRAMFMTACRAAS
ncbi:hypothetical protein D3C87_1082850 [compost metagenome]